MFFKSHYHIPGRLGFRFCCAGAALVALLLLILQKPAGQSPPSASSFSSGTLQRTVSVSGDVRHPGIYQLSANNMADSVIKMAVPLCTIVTVEQQRLARFFPVDGDLMTVACGDHGGTVHQTVMPVAQRLVLKIPLQISRMNETDFERLPGIGPVTAQRIIAHRQNNGGKMTVEDLKCIEGIGEKKFQILKNVLTN